MTALRADLDDAPPRRRPGTDPEAVGAGDAPDLRGAFAAQRGELFGFAFRSLRDRSLAEDAVQETFLRAWKARARYDAAIGPVRAWLFAIERHVVIDLARTRARRHATLTDSTPEDAPRPDDQVDRALESWQVQEAISRLSPEHRQVVVEMYYRSRPSAEFAVQMGIPEGTARSRLFYALRNLRLQLEEMGWSG